MQIKINNASFGYNGENLLENINFEVNNNEKIAIVGKNGSGKTTILKILTGEIELHQPDNCPPVFLKLANPTIGTLNQISFNNENETLENELLKSYQSIIDLKNKLDELQQKLENDYSEKLISAFSKLSDEFERNGGYTYKSELASVISSFGFSEFDKQKKLSEFSGGQKTKIAFIKLILSKPDVLILDEPTNHLDIKAINWLENYINAYKKSVVIVSHDRAFLDNTVNVVYEIEHKHVRKYIGNYSKFIKLKNEMFESQLKMYEAQQRQIADIKEFIERFRYKATKATAVQSRIKMLEKMEIIPKPEKPDTKTFITKIKPEIQSGMEVLSCSNLMIGYDKNNPLACINLKLNRGERLGIIGGNGLGKSTFLKVITEKIPAISGHFKFGYHVQYGYFEQLSQKYSSTKSIFEEFSNEFPDLSGTEVRSSLGAFLFSGNEVTKQLCSLSGGESVRFELCKILQRKPNVLILDEPTNHTDIASKEALENLLSLFDGTIIFVSHDRYFTQKIATKLLIFDENGANFYDGTYLEYSHPSTQIIKKVTKEIEEKPKKEKIEYPIDYDENDSQDELSKLSYYEANKEKNKVENQIKKIEEKSKLAEEKLKNLNNDFVSPEFSSDFIKLMEIEGQIEETNLQINSYANDWIELNEKLTKLTEIVNKNNQNKSD